MIIILPFASLISSMLFVLYNPQLLNKSTNKWQKTACIHSFCAKNKPQPLSLCWDSRKNKLYGINQQLESTY